MSTTTPDPSPSVTIVTTDVDTPAGPVRVAVRGERVVVCCFVDHWERLAPKVRRRFPDATWTEGASGAADRLAAYVAGDLGALDDLEVDSGGTDFQQRVWAALRSIPTGETWSYRELAEAAGAGGGMRAVGQANGANPVWLVVPCHRVIRSDGSIGGYGGGVDRKAWLLEHEGVTGVTGVADVSTVRSAP